MEYNSEHQQLNHQNDQLTDFLPQLLTQKKRKNFDFLNVKSNLTNFNSERQLIDLMTSSTNNKKTIEPCPKCTESSVQKYEKTSNSFIQSLSNKMKPKRRTISLIDLNNKSNSKSFSDGDKPIFKSNQFSEECSIIDNFVSKNEKIFNDCAHCCYMLDNEDNNKEIRLRSMSARVVKENSCSLIDQTVPYELFKNVKNKKNKPLKFEELTYSNSDETVNFENFSNQSFYKQCNVTYVLFIKELDHFYSSF